MNENYEEMLSVATWAIDVGELSTAGDVLHFFEKPWHYLGLFAEYHLSEYLSEEGATSG